MLNQGKRGTATELLNLIMANLKQTIIRFINWKYCKKALLNSDQLERIDLRKHQFARVTKILINESLIAKK